MNTTAGPQWSQPEQFNDIAAMGDQDFANFVDLDLGDIDDLNLPIFDADGQPTANFVPVSETQHHHEQQQQASADAISQSANIFGVNMHMPFDGRQDHNFALAQGQPPASQQQMIPPTPNSAEIQSAAASRFLEQFDPQVRAQIIEQQYHQLRKAEGQNSFTPLVSPAVTPHDGRFHIPQEYGVQPGVYFSPLTSPALEGQMHPYQNNNTSASSVATSSPVDLNVDMLGEAAMPQQQSRKRQKRPDTPRSTAATTRVGKSPMARPMQTRRKGNLSSVVPSKPMQQLVGQAQKPNLSPTSPTVPQPLYSQTSSGTGSISPEPLSEAIMGPPPKPASAQQSPAIHPQSRSNSSFSLNAQAVPATPSTLLKARDTHLSTIAQPLASPNGTVMEELSLPEPADSSRPILERIETATNEDCSTPRISARKTPKLGPLSTPGSATLSGQNTSRPTPVTSAITSPTTASMSPVRKSDSRGGRTAKKRSSMSSSSALVSPALRPKISPSIRPMLPATADGNIAMDEAMQTHFLTQRSNYQNLIEGTHVPGVSYPSELSTNLTSKRTSHKIAEQGRRNRINIALQEMLSLLPPKNGSPQTLNVKSPAAEDEDEDEDGGSGGKGKMGKQGGNSKAATVESAIEYIRSLQTERQVFCRRIEERDREVEELRKRLDEMEKRLGTLLEPL